MRHTFFFLILLFFSALSFAQQNSAFRVIGRIPNEGDTRLYQIQAGAFRNFQNAEIAYQRLNSASLNPAYDSFLSLTRVVINGVAAGDVPAYLQRIRNTGFTEVIIRIDSSSAVAQPPILEEPVIPAAIITEEPPPSVPVVEPEPLPLVAGQLLPAPGNRLPESGNRIGAEDLRQQRKIVFSWDAVDGASAYVITIREASQERREIFRTDPMEQLYYTFEDLKRLDNDGTYVWQVEALRRNSQGTVEQRGQPGESTFTLNVPRPGQVRTRNVGVLYGN
jgi:hypothetical protein